MQFHDSSIYDECFDLTSFLRLSVHDFAPFRDIMGQRLSETVAEQLYITVREE